MHSSMRMACFLAAMAALLSIPACDSDNSPVSTRTADDALLRTTAHVASAPGTLVSVTVGSESLNLWPYLTPNGETAEDPVNLVFAGAVGAREIRAALLALDGNRTGYGVPNVFPLNQPWTDAMGGAQAAYVDEDGWVGGVIQLSLGTYGPLRLHLRLYQSAVPYGESGHWTLGGTHFEMQIPGTPEHQVLSWELAEMIVKVDLVRSGLLVAAPSTSGLINDAPGYRTIPPALFNPLPDPLKQLLGLPTGQSSVPVAIPTDGHATLFQVGTTNADPGNGGTQTLSLQFHQIIPKPFCAAGPADYYLVDGPIDLVKDVRIDGVGRYSYRYQLSGHITATPVGGGASFEANVQDIQSGFLDDRHASLNANSKRIAPQDGGTELLMQWLKVGTDGENQFSSFDKCLTQ